MVQSLSPWVHRAALRWRRTIHLARSANKMYHYISNAKSIVSVASIQSNPGKSKIEGTPILMLATVKRLQVKKFVKKTHQKIRQNIRQKCLEKFVKKFVKKIHQKICQKKSSKTSP